MSFLKILALVCIMASLASALPVDRRVKPEPIQPSSSDDSPTSTHDLVNQLEYSHYLNEVVMHLENDPEFSKRLKNASEADIRTGKIAEQLEFVSHNVRTKLDELKRKELDRLKLLANRERKINLGIDHDDFKMPEHMHDDKTKLNSFDIKDLEKLMKKTLHDIDEKRRNDFKDYEMQKEFERKNHLNSLPEEERKKAEKEYEEAQNHKEKSEPLHHPGNLPQLEEVWNEQDNMDQDFDPKIFFPMHDLNGDGMWEEDEVEALFVKTLGKKYTEDSDPKEKYEEMKRMREHYFQEADLNGDNLVSFEEFIEMTRTEQFKEDPGWKTIDEQPQYTHEEYLEFERRRKAEIDRLIAQGQLSPSAGVPIGHYEPPLNQFQPQYGQPVQLNANQMYQNVPVNQPQGVPQYAPVQPNQAHHQQVYQQQPMPVQYQQHPPIVQQQQQLPVNNQVPPQQAQQQHQQYVPVQPTQQQQQFAPSQQQQQAPAQQAQQQHYAPAQQQQQQVPAQQAQQQLQQPNAANQQPAAPVKTQPDLNAAHQLSNSI